ncbi:MAG TPA: DNA repair protein RadA [Myxococcales bacterium]|nr:DNA repair protein RadA [Myxococcales bacterium]HIM00891.1 DNA repair protein RadA [Myxococcales bacterium]
MAKPKTLYSCSHCGTQHPQWLGRCHDCGKWGTLEEEVFSPNAAKDAIPSAARNLLGVSAPASHASEKIRILGEIEPGDHTRLSSGIGELDRVLGGGFVPGSVVLLGGEPGVGKSTLALQLAARVDAASVQAGEGTRNVLYISGEESPEQVRLRAERLEEQGDGVAILAETRVEAFAEAWRDLQPKLVIVDSVQTLQTSRVESSPGSVAQVRESASLLAATAKLNTTTLVLVGHVTKDGSLAGPRVLEHLVDVVLNFEGDRNHAFRLLRASKNRFGSTQEVGVFTMAEKGLEAVDNPSELFLAEHRDGAPGSCIIPLLEGSRPMLVEIQSLVAAATYGTPRRTTIGIDDGRVALILAVLDRRTPVDLVSRDVYVNVAGGVRVNEPAADLGLALAIASSALDIPLPPRTAACGEIGLGGEVRRVSRLDLRIKELGRLGYEQLLVPPGTRAAVKKPGCTLIEVENIANVVAWLRDA